jgi:uncharacterized protein (DUF1778 family)
MTINKLAPQKMPHGNGGRKDWPTIGARVSPTNLHLVDAAATREGKTRADFIADAVMTRVAIVLELAA